MHACIRTWLQNNMRDIQARIRPRFFDEVVHQTTNASIGNNYIFTKYSSVPNRGIGPNKRAGGKILKKHETCRPK